MLCKTLSFTDFNDVERKENYYFNLTETEIFEIKAANNGEFTKYLTNIIDTKNEEESIRFIKKIILKAYGKKSEDGSSFIKNEKMAEEFSYSAAFNALFVELVTVENALKSFLIGIIPKNASDKLAGMSDKDLEKVIEDEKSKILSLDTQSV